MGALSHKPAYRALEIIPGVLIWTTFIGTVVLSFVRPLWVMVFIIVFAVLWLLRVTYFVFYLVLSWRNFKIARAVNWEHRRNQTRGWEKILHVVFLPTYKEPLSVLEHTMEALARSRYPTERVIVVLAGEQRDEEHFLKNADTLRQRYAEKFHSIIVTVHPQGLVGELACKGANAKWAGHQVKKQIDELKIPYEDIVVSYFDCDTCVDPQYFSQLTVSYLEHPDRLHTSFQPIAFYTNNIWDSPAIMRVSAFSTTFWLMTELARPERLFTFSSQAMSWQALIDVDFWEADVVTDDSRIFLQCFLRYDGRYTVSPLYIPVYMDTVRSVSWLKSLQNLYFQQRRWGWGIEHFPYMVWHFYHNKKIPWGKKIHYLWNLGEGMYTWATTPILLFVLGRLPLYVVSTRNDTSLLAHNTPFVLEWMMLASMIGVIVSAIFATLLLPIRPEGHSRWKTIMMVLQWLLLPITLILFGSIPASEAQTRLMLGKYLGFHVTEKIRRDPPPIVSSKTSTAHV